MAVDEEEGTDNATRAFEALRAEIVSLRRAKEALEPTVKESREPDYSSTLGVLASSLEAVASRVAAIEKYTGAALPAEVARREIARVYDASLRRARGTWSGPRARCRTPLTSCRGDRLGPRPPRAAGVDPAYSRHRGGGRHNDVSARRLIRTGSRPSCSARTAGAPARGWRVAPIRVGGPTSSRATRRHMPPVAISSPASTPRRRSAGSSAARSRSGRFCRLAELRSGRDGWSGWPPSEMADSQPVPEIASRWEPGSLPI